VVLRQAYRLQSLQSAIHEEKIKKIFRLLSAAAIEPILIKGWAAAGLYPERGLRPYGDIDLVVRPEHYNRAMSIVASPEAKDCWVDLHKEISELGDRPLGQLFDRSQRVSHGDEFIRVLSSEDHLALLAVHLLKHGAWRPLWLCDIGAAVESLRADFDWELCLGQDRRRAGWITCAIGLAHVLLGTRIESVLIADRATKLPVWLVPAVLRQWQHPYATNQPPTKHPVPFAIQLRHPSGLWQGLRERWPDPILATVSVHGRFNRLPRFPYQVANCVVRVGQFLRRLPQVAQGE
ncbi:MAG TPA: nucleotidyltransferase family protein, partial [Pyrinomonadaceae bacterium]|nr:nucleotidyltransferase family protein [Pyrinomonadaceae bacterium]